MSSSGIADLQPELALRLKAARGVNRDSVAELCGLLHGRGWATARELQTLRPEWTERFVRLLASASGGRVLSYPGSPGYRLTSEMSPEETEIISHAGAALIHQGRSMARRGIVFRRVAALRAAEQEALAP